MSNSNQQSMISNKYFNQWLWVSLLTILLSACGFQLRGLTELPFKSINFQGQVLTISKSLEANLIANHVKILPSPDNADLTVELISENTEKRILSLSGGGTVRQYELDYKVFYRIKANGSATWGQVQTADTRRDLSYSDSELLAKQNEEVLLYEGMHNDIVNTLIRRLSTYNKP